MQIPGALASKMAHSALKSLVHRLPGCLIYMVRVERLELPCLSAVEPKSTASTNSAIPALTAEPPSHNTKAAGPQVSRLYITRLEVRKEKPRTSAWPIPDVNFGSRHAY